MMAERAKVEPASVDLPAGAATFDPAMLGRFERENAEMERGQAPDPPPQLCVTPWLRSLPPRPRTGARRRSRRARFDASGGGAPGTAPQRRRVVGGGIPMMRKAHVWPEEMGLEDGEPILQPLEATRKVSAGAGRSAPMRGDRTRRLAPDGAPKHFDSADPFALPECEFHLAMEVIRDV